MLYKTILFDFDGTLVPSLDFWLDGFKYAFGKLGIDVSESVIIDRCFYRKGQEIVREFNLECSDTFWRLTAESLAVSYATPTLFPGAQEVLDHCRKEKIAMGLVTSSEKTFVKNALQVLQIAHYFDAVVTANDVSHLKPHPEPVLQALDTLKARADQTLFVGDYVVDVQAGKAAGTSTGLFYTDVHSRFHRYEHVASSFPDFIFSNYPELLDRLRQPLPV